MPSEAPFEKLGGPLVPDPSDRSVSIRPGPNETPFSIAHRGTGEWRNWRSILELNGIDSPFNVSERAQVGSISTAADPADLEGVDFLSEFGMEHSWVYVSSEAPEAFSIQLADVSGGFKILASLPGGTTSDAYVLIQDSVDGQDVVEFSAYVGDETIDIRMSSEAWLIFWLHRVMHLESNLISTRSIALLPPA